MRSLCGHRYAGASALWDFETRRILPGASAMAGGRTNRAAKKHVSQSSGSGQEPTVAQSGCCPAFQRRGVEVHHWTGVSVYPAGRDLYEPETEQHAYPATAAGKVSARA